MWSARRRLVALPQELEELHALAQAALHHLRAAHHLADDRGDLRRAEIEAPVEGLDAVEDLGVRQMRVVQRRDLHAVLVDQLGMLGVEPAILDRLLVQERAGIGRGERDLQRVRVDLGGEADGLLDRLLGLAGQAEDEGAVDLDAEFVAVLGELLRDLDPHALLDVVQDLLVAALVADQQQPQAVVLAAPSSVSRGTLALALQDQVTPSLPSSRAIASARGRLSVKVSSSKKNSRTCGK